MSYCDFVAGWVGGMVGLLVGHPLDTVKVNQQTKGIGIRRCIQEVYKQAGYKGFYRGMGFPLIAQGAMNSAFFGVYGYTLDYLTKLDNSREIKKNNGDSSTALNRGHQGSYLNVTLAGFVAGFAHLVIACPVDVIKIKLQVVWSEPRFRGPYLLVRHLLRTQGIRGLYQGVTTMAWRDTPSFGLYMLVYEMGSNKVKSWNADENEMPSPFGLFMAGGVAGAVCWISILPLDVIKSRVQSQDRSRPDCKGAIECTRQIFREQGMKGFFRGFWSLSIRAFPVNGATLLTYEWFNYLCRYINGPADTTLISIGSIRDEVY